MAALSPYKADMMDRNLEDNLVQKAQMLGLRRVQVAQSEIAENLQVAVPDGALELDMDGGVTLRAPRTFARMMQNDRLRFPQFLTGRFIP